MISLDNLNMTISNTDSKLSLLNKTINLPITKVSNLLISNKVNSRQLQITINNNLSILSLTCSSPNTFHLNLNLISNKITIPK